MPGRPSSKKIAKRREQKKNEELGVRVPLTHSGVPVKAKKPSYICSVCRLELTPTTKQQLVDHWTSKHDKSASLEVVFPSWSD